MTTQTLTLTEFLLARIAEDEAVAHNLTAFHSAPDYLGTSIEGLLRRRSDVGPSFITNEAATLAEVKHIARHGPARVLAECEAKRQIVAWHEPDDEGFCGDGIGLRGDHWRHPCATLRSLAAVYADHPDYDGAWRP